MNGKTSDWIESDTGYWPATNGVEEEPKEPEEITFGKYKDRYGHIVIHRAIARSYAYELSQFFFTIDFLPTAIRRGTFSSPGTIYSGYSTIFQETDIQIPVEDLGTNRYLINGAPNFRLSQLKAGELTPCCVYLDFNSEYAKIWQGIVASHAQDFHGLPKIEKANNHYKPASSKVFLDSESVYRCFVQERVAIEKVKSMKKSY